MSEINFDQIDKAAKKAPLTSSKKDTQKKKSKLISYPEEWEIVLLQRFGDTNISQYIVNGFRDKLIKDGVLK